MKKILSFLIMGAMAFGLIGCSGDLHDEEAPSQIYIIGSAVGTWEPTAAPAMLKKSDTAYSYTGALSAGEYKFIQYKNWSIQWGSDGKGTNQAAWKITEPATYVVTYDVATETMTATSLSTSLDDPQKIATVPWLYGGIGSVKLTKSGTSYTGSFNVGSTGCGSWGESVGYIRCALISCVANTAGTEPDLGNGWCNVVSRYGSGKDDPQTEDSMSTNGTYTGLKEGYYCLVGSEYKGLVSGGNFVIKDVEASTSYDVLIEMSSGSPVITITKNK